MYDELITEISLTSDEKDILLSSVEKLLDTAVSVGERITLESLIEKLSR